MPRYERIRVTPRMAREWLEHNADNQRNPKQAKIPGYARDMKAIVKNPDGSNVVTEDGRVKTRWNENTAETIKFATDEKGELVLIDGQNRLHAVILADGGPNGSVIFDVAFDVPLDAMDSLDSGAARTFADKLKIVSGDRMKASAIVRWLMNYDAGLPMNYGMGSNRTHAELIEFYRSDPLMFEAAWQRANDAYKRGLGAVAPVGTAFALFYRIDQDRAHDFFDKVVSGANLPERHPALVLRDRMGRARLDRTTRAETLALYIRAWNYYQRDELIRGNLVIVKGDLGNLNFPKPKAPGAARASEVE